MEAPLTASVQKLVVFLLFLCALLLAAPRGFAADQGFILVQSTTSTQNSGLLDHILPKFTRRTGIEVRVVAVGTGQALKNARNGDADVVFVHSREDEERFVSEGWGVERHDVMYNDFVIVGPTSDPAGIRGLSDAEQAFEKIAMVEAPFASRGDNSGTHKAELKLWKNSEIDPLRSSGDWYLETGSGMGATLNTAVGKRAYALTDRGTWLGFTNKNGFEVLVEGDRQLLNQYGVILVSPEKHPNVKAKMGAAFVDWLTSTEGQKAIASFKIDGQQLFFPNARPRA